MSLITARALEEDLTAAGIPKHAPGGKLDFHACRLAYFNLVIESGTTVKEAQALAQHATPAMTMNTNGPVSEERRAAAVEGIARKLPLGAEGVPSMYRMAVGAETESATPFENKELRSSEDGGGGGSRTRSHLLLLQRTTAAHPQQTRYVPARWLVPSRTAPNRTLTGLRTRPTAPRTRSVQHTCNGIWPRIWPRWSRHGPLCLRRLGRRLSRWYGTPTPRPALRANQDSGQTRRRATSPTSVTGTRPVLDPSPFRFQRTLTTLVSYLTLV